MDYYSKIEDFLKSHKGVITNSQCQELNIPTVYLGRLVEKGKLFKVSRGIYASEDVDYDELYFFQLQYKKAIFSYESALYLLGATDRIVTNYEVSVYNSYKFNAKKDNVIVHYVNKDIYDLGIIDIKTKFGNTVKCYSYERVLCDYILNEKDVDQEAFFQALKSYIKYKDKDIFSLIDIAKKLGVETKIRKLMEVLS